HREAERADGRRHHERGQALRGDAAAHHEDRLADDRAEDEQVAEERPRTARPEPAGRVERQDPRDGEGDAERARTAPALAEPDDDGAGDDRHGGRQLEAGAERKRYWSGAGGTSAAARLTWSASLQNAHTVPVVTWPQRAHSFSCTASARSNAGRAFSRKPNRKLCLAPGDASSMRLRISLCAMEVAPLANGHSSTM